MWIFFELKSIHGFCRQCFCRVGRRNGDQISLRWGKYIKLQTVSCLQRQEAVEMVLWQSHSNLQARNSYIEQKFYVVLLTKYQASFQTIISSLIASTSWSGLLTLALRYFQICQHMSMQAKVAPVALPKTEPRLYPPICRLETFYPRGRK